MKLYRVRDAEGTFLMDCTLEVLVAVFKLREEVLVRLANEPNCNIFFNRPTTKWREIRVSSWIDSLTLEKAG